ncbi:class I adenylate-forming enzyme family protein [Quadrisphaera sp. GCM10027208]|uniref:class I adenylate-forming enzyme family protein n=1 Tax=Quadrisphaera sp. GCM10027208 TaxID=3273423 RepID=UPI00360D870F
MDLTAMLESTAHKFPRKPAVVAGETALSYEELLDASKRAAAVLRDAGVGRGDRVGVMTYNTPAFVVAAFGIWRAGAVLVPLNHKYASAEVAYVTRHAGVRVAVVDAGLAATAQADTADTRWLVTTDDGSGEFDTLVAAASPWDGVAVDDTEIAELLYTSGTVAEPKGCLHSHRGIHSVAAYTTATMGLRRTDRFLISMPIWHASPLNNWFLSMMFVGGTVVLQREYQPLEFLRTVSERRVTAFFGAPIAYLAPLQAAPAAGVDLADFDLSSVRAWIYGAAPLGADTVRRLQQVYRSDAFYQVYGMTEMGPVGTALYPEDQVTKAGSVGAGGMPGVDVRVMGPDGALVAPGQPGEVWIRSDTRMVGYLDDPDATAACFEGPWYKTGDLAVVDEDGYLFIVDRLKDIIITGGENVFSPEVEEALLQHPHVRDAAVVGRPHPEWGETVVAFLVTDGTPVDVEELREFLAPRLARYKIPREVVVRDALPRNPSGKITKHVLRRDLQPSG